ncbi:SH3 domain-containing protein (plasmid) [Streptomycetaceae bacterium NBC_01309]
MRRLSRAGGALAGSLALACVLTSPALAAPSHHGAAPAARPLSAQYLCFYEVTGDNVRIRTGPGTNYTAFGQMHRGDKFQSGTLSNGWAHGYSSRHARSGWISMTYLRIIPGTCR